MRRAPKANSTSGIAVSGPPTISKAWSDRRVRHDAVTGKLAPDQVGDADRRQQQRLAGEAGERIDADDLAHQRRRDRTKRQRERDPRRMTGRPRQPADADRGDGNSRPLRRFRRSENNTTPSSDVDERIDEVAETGLDDAGWRDA